MSESKSSNNSTSQNCDLPGRTKFRKSHTKSRHGCHTCKLRRVKCDEARPICGGCSFRGSECSFPEHGEHTNANSSTDPKPLTRMRPVPSPLIPLEFGVSESLRPVDDSSTQPGGLNMNDLRLLQHFLLHTAKSMSLNPERALVWQRVIPELASKNEFLMHLMLALAGVHLLSEETVLSKGQDRNQTNIVSGANADADADDLTKSVSIDLHLVIEHHQKGLQMFQEELSKVTTATAEAVSSGAFLVVAFAFASLRLRDLEESFTSAVQQVHSELPRLDWLYLVRGLTIVTGQHWYTLRRSRLRALLDYRYRNDDWKLHPLLSTSSLPRLKYCSPRLKRFAHGAHEAISNLRIFIANTTSIVTPDSTNSSCRLLPKKQNENSQTIDIMEEMYMRILHVLHFPGSEQDSSTTLDIQTDIEDSAVTSWPHLVPGGFICTLDWGDGFGVAEGVSCILLAHFYLLFALFEDTWFLRGGFEKEISKINTLVGDSRGGQLGSLMRWPMEVITSME